MNKYFLKHAFYRVISMMLLVAIVFYIGKQLFPGWSKIIFTRYFWSIYIVATIYFGYNRYKELKDISKHLDFIYDTKKEELSYAKMEKYALWSEAFTEINKTKLDILKSFSPIPLIIFILGVYINNTPSIRNEISIFSSKLLLGDILIYLGIGIPIFYSFFLYSTFRLYRNSVRKTADYRAEAIILKEQTKGKQVRENKD